MKRQTVQLLIVILLESILTNDVKSEDLTWPQFSELIFRKSENLPEKEKSLFGATCDDSLYDQYSPVWALANPTGGKDEDKSKEVLERANAMKALGEAFEAKTAPSNPSAKELYDKWEAEPRTENYPGQWLYEQICYSDGNEMLECFVGKCVCPRTDTFPNLRMKQMHKLHPVSEKELEESGCFSKDCGLCYVGSKVCGEWGTCKSHEMQSTIHWPHKEMDGMCKDSIQNLNNQLGRH